MPDAVIVATARSRVRAGAFVASIEPLSQGIPVFSTVTIEREGGEKPVCVAETITCLVP